MSKAKPRAKPRPPKGTQPGKNGGVLNVGGTFPGGGRPPDAWKQMCRDLASNDEMIQLAHEVLKSPYHKAWLGAWRFVAEQGFGKPEGESDRPPPVLERWVIAIPVERPSSLPVRQIGGEVHANGNGR